MSQICLNLDNLEIKFLMEYPQIPLIILWSIKGCLNSGDPEGPDAPRGPARNILPGVRWVVATALILIMPLYIYQYNQDVSVCHTLGLYDTVCNKNTRT